MKYIFKHSSTFEMGRSVHHHLIYFMLKKTFQKGEPKLYKYSCSYKHKQFENATVHTDLPMTVLKSTNILKRIL